MTDEGPRRRRKLSAIMMADVCGFSRMMGQDDERTVDLIKDFHRRLQQHIEAFEGRVVDTAGDSVLGEFDSVVNAVHCARRIQQDLATINTERPQQERVSTRIGVHLGDVIVEDYNVYGDGVNIAARLEPMADPGGICISEAVYQQVRDKIDVSVVDGGFCELKNIQYPVHIFRIAPLPEVALAPPPERPVAAASIPAVSSSVESAAPVAQDLPWSTALRRPDNLVLLLVGGVLLLSPIALFPSAGVLPSGGAILIALAIGRALSQHQGRKRPFLIALGAGIASCALWTNWSRVTNVLLVLAGAIVGSVAAGGEWRGRPGRRQERRGD